MLEIPYLGGMLSRSLLVRGFKEIRGKVSTKGIDRIWPLQLKR